MMTLSQKIDQLQAKDFTIKISGANANSPIEIIDSNGVIKMSYSPYDEEGAESDIVTALEFAIDKYFTLHWLESYRCEDKEGEKSE